MKYDTKQSVTCSSVIRPDSSLAATVFCTAVAVRLVLGWMLISGLDDDPDAYQAIARCLRTTGIFGLLREDTAGGEVTGVATAFRPPLYPIVLSLLPGNSVAILWLHSLLGGWTVLVTFLACRNFFAGQDRIHSGQAADKPRCLPVAAGLTVLCDPILINQSSLVMTETLATAISATLLWWCTGWANDSFGSKIPGVAVSSWMKLFLWPAGLGAMMLAGYFCRPTFLVWALFLLVALLVSDLFRGISGATGRLHQRLVPSLVAGLIAGLVIGTGVCLWTLRNTRAVGHPVWATTHGGYTLLLGNNPEFYQYLRQRQPGQVWDANTFLRRYEDSVSSLQSPIEPPVESSRLPSTDAKKVATEVLVDRAAYRQAKTTIRNQPAMFAYSCLVRWARLWSPMPHSVPGRGRWSVVAVTVFYVAVYVMTLVGLVRLRRRLRERFTLAAITLFLSLSLVHSLYWSNLRMRAPAIPALAVIAVASVARRQSIQGSDTDHSSVWAV